MSAVSAESDLVIVVVAEELAAESDLAEVEDSLETMMMEMEVAMNGPVLVEADKLLKKAMDRYWNGKRWHFITKTDIQDFKKTSLASKRHKRIVQSCHS